MKVRKGKIKLDGRDLRLGNFVVRYDKGKMSFRDINSMVSVYLDINNASGALWRMMYEQAREGGEDALKNIEARVIAYYNALSVVSDTDFLLEINKSSIDCVNRHKELYGIDENISKEEDDKILQDVKEELEAEEEIKKS